MALQDLILTPSRFPVTSLDRSHRTGRSPFGRTLYLARSSISHCLPVWSHPQARILHSYSTTFAHMASPLPVTVRVPEPRFGSGLNVATRNLPHADLFEGHPNTMSMDLELPLNSRHSFSKLFLIAGHHQRQNPFHKSKVTGGEISRHQAGDTVPQEPLRRLLISTMRRSSWERWRRLLLMIGKTFWITHAAWYLIFEAYSWIRLIQGALLLHLALSCSDEGGCSDLSERSSPSRDEGQT